MLQTTPMKKQLNVDLIQSELRGGSAFFPGYRGSSSPTSPSDQSASPGEQPVVDRNAPGQRESQVVDRVGVPPTVPRPVPRPVPLVPKCLSGNISERKLAFSGCEQSLVPEGDLSRWRLRRLKNPMISRSGFRTDTKAKRPMRQR